MLPHLLRDGSEANTGEEVDREARVLGVVHREDVAEVVAQTGVGEPLGELLEAHSLRHLLEKDLDKDTRGRCRVVFVHLDCVEDEPGNRVRRKYCERRISTYPVGKGNRGNAR